MAAAVARRCHMSSSDAFGVGFPMRLVMSLRPGRLCDRGRCDRWRAIGLVRCDGRRRAFDRRRRRLVEFAVSRITRTQNLADDVLVRPGSTVRLQATTLDPELAQERRTVEVGQRSTGPTRDCGRGVVVRIDAVDRLKDRAQQRARDFAGLGVAAGDAVEQVEGVDLRLSYLPP